MNNDILFNEIFDGVCDQYNLAWWEVFDSEKMDEVECLIAEQFGVADAWEIEGFAGWYNEMAMDL